MQGGTGVNNFKLEIYDYKDKKYKEYPTAVFPLKIVNLLDERLDESQVFLKRIETEYFAPFTAVRITVINSPKAKYNSALRVEKRAETAVQIEYDPNTKRITEKLTIDYVIANDKSVESPIGSGKFNHELYLIETTKRLEAYVGDSITFTNPLGNNYIKDEWQISINAIGIIKKTLGTTELATIEQITFDWNETGEKTVTIDNNNIVPAELTVVIKRNYRFDSLEISSGVSDYINFTMLSNETTSAGNVRKYRLEVVKKPENVGLTSVILTFFIKSN